MPIQIFIKSNYSTKFILGMALRYSIKYFHQQLPVAFPEPLSEKPLVDEVVKPTPSSVDSTLPL